MKLNVLKDCGLDSLSRLKGSNAAVRVLGCNLGEQVEVEEWIGCHLVSVNGKTIGMGE